jgi:lipopolysaccharide/colanic/teichoic acid biosynthesis glycosyltransferase
MLTQYQLTIGGMSRLVDATIIGVVWLASFWLRFHVPVIEVTKGFPPFSSYAALTPLVVVLWAVILEAQKVYQPLGTKRRFAENAILLKAHTSAILCFIALTYVITEYRYSRGVMIYFGVLGALALVVSRFVLRAIFRVLQNRGYQTCKVLLVGEGPSLELLISRIIHCPDLGLQIAGVLVSEGSTTAEVAGQTVLGHFGDVSRAIADTRAHKVLIALSRQHWVELERIPIVSLNESPMLGWRAAVKRVTDIALSAVALILGSPIFFFISLAVKATSKGPIFYGQERMGLDGCTFKMYKFRSMRVDAESSTGAVWAKAGDDRRTPIGSFLRATSLDEIPQFWNVLVGNMSLVGPRPERPVFVSQFRHEISHYMLRHRVKSGVTGWAQVNGWRGNTSLDQRILCDLYYIRHWSYLFDLKILFLTIWKGFVNRNAY